MEKRIYTSDEVTEQFYTEVRNSHLDAQRVPARDSSKEALKRLAKDIYNRNYKDALHESVLE